MKALVYGIEPGGLEQREFLAFLRWDMGDLGKGGWCCVWGGFFFDILFTRYVGSRTDRIRGVGLFFGFR